MVSVNVFVNVFKNQKNWLDEWFDHLIRVDTDNLLLSQDVGQVCWSAKTEVATEMEVRKQSMEARTKAA